MNRKTYKVIITGSGTRSQIEHSLRDLLRRLVDEDSSSVVELDNSKWEDEVLLAEFDEE